MGTLIDPLTSLTVSMQAQKGVYAVLLGSGVSKDAGVPTGWGIINSLIARLAKAQEQEPSPDPESWYQETYKKPAHYSDLLKQLAPTQESRLQMLREFFEPTDDEREEGLKTPTPAHRAIAKLVANGYIRVIVTTNFDRLLEQAITDEGVQPSIISGPDSAKGALPLIHAPVTLVKIHGDYLDTRLLNTEEELRAYKPPLVKLLDRILDEFGLIVCGWSAVWDEGLRNAIERTPSRRFPTYWTHVRQPSDQAQSLGEKKGAIFVEIESANDFFGKLRDGVLALADFQAADPVEPRVVVARAKRFLSRQEEGRIALHDLIRIEADHLCELLSSDEFSTAEEGPNSITPRLPLVRISRYESVSQRFAALMACGAFWAKQEEDYGVFLRAFRRIAEVSQHAPYGPYIPFWEQLHRYPALFVLYVSGVSAVAAGNYALLRDLLYMKVRPPGKDLTIAEALDPLMVIQDPKDVFHGSTSELTASSTHLYPLISQLVRDYASSDREYQDAFFFFEYVWALTWHDIGISSEELLQYKDNSKLALAGSPLGVFAQGWSYHDPPTIPEFAQVKFAEGSIPGRLAELPRLGFFEGSAQKMRLLKIGLDQRIHELRRKRLVGR